MSDSINLEELKTSIIEELIPEINTIVRDAINKERDNLKTEDILKELVKNNVRKTH